MSEGSTTASIHLMSSGDPRITVQTKPEVRFAGFIRYTVGGVEVGTLDATFDFSKLPPEIHADAVQFLARGGYCMEIGPVAHLYWPDRFITPPPLPSLPSLWEQVTAWWRGQTQQPRNQ